MEESAEAAGRRALALLVLMILRSALLCVPAHACTRLRVCARLCVSVCVSARLCVAA